MELTISKSPSSTSALNPLMPRLHHHLSMSPPRSLSLGCRLIAYRLSCMHNTRFRWPSSVLVPAPPSASSHYSFRSRTLALPSKGLQRISSSASSSASAGGGGGSFGGESGGGGCGSDGGDAESKSLASAAEAASALPSDVIVLDVGGMMCGGCAASVKRILESQAQVSSASVDLTTETAIVWPVSEAKSEPNWQKELGKALAKHLTNCSFTSTLRGQEAIEGDDMS